MDKRWRISCQAPMRGKYGDPLPTKDIVWAPDEIAALEKWAKAVNGQISFALCEDGVEEAYVFSLYGGETYHWNCTEDIHPWKEPIVMYKKDGGYRVIQICTLIHHLEQELEKGACIAYIKGTLITDQNNSVVLTSESQI